MTGMMKKVELLAPAGCYEALIGAFRAGADAVYLGGEKFGARAYADNFSKEEICRVLRYAHIWGKKIYLTVNTLVKESEFSSLYEYLSPFYEAGLDGIIIQDLGVWQYVRETFPGLALHASTQMAVMGSGGASLLKREGAARIVPARELSLAEVKAIREKTGLELECFIHGAMCYSYSGQCLFSSILGGRSGNRGRCAQPCRLPYAVSDPETGRKTGEMHVLSLKDMCTIAFLPKLLEAGIDSFKIEGRMKRPEYAAGVTAIYRRYIDAFYQYGADAYHVKPEDLDRLQRLYIRDEVQTGYYERMNGKEMITLGKAGYTGPDEALVHEIAERYPGQEKKCSVTIRGAFQIGEAAVLQIEGEGISRTVSGTVVERAKTRPMPQEDFLKHLRKMGNSFLRITKERISVDQDAFMPVGSLNELRRRAVKAFEDSLIEENGLLSGRSGVQDTLQNKLQKTKETSEKAQLHVAVQNMEQLKAALKYPLERIYIDSDWYLAEFDRISRHMAGQEAAAVFLALPYVTREKDLEYYEKLFSLLRTEKGIKGFLVRNLESLFRAEYFIKTYKSGPFEIVADAGVYCFNAEAFRFLQRSCQEVYLPYELNGKECRQLLSRCGQRLSMIVYGTIPMMISANCVRKTSDICGKERGDTETGRPVFLTDRYHTKFPVQCRCRHCYNIIYNSVPLSLHQKFQEIRETGIYAARLDFVWETGELAEKILDFYCGRTENFPVTEYTAGHYKRGVE